jgi:hypothetical protein
MRAPYLRLFCIAIAVGVFVLAAGRQGYAALEYRISAGSSTGIATNAASQSNGSATGLDGFETVQGRLQVSTVGQYTRNQLAYGLGATTWFRGTQGFSLSQTLGLGSTIEAGPATIITLDGSATLMQLSMLDTSASTVDPQTVGPRPAGNQLTLALQAGEGITWQPSPSWRLGESLQGRLFRPVHRDVAVAENKGLTVEAQLSYVWTQDTAGLRGRAGEVWAGSTGNATTSNPNSQFAEGSVGWTHQWTEEWSHDVAAGVVALRVGDTDARLAPSASAGVLWRRLGNVIELRAGQGAESNVYVGTAYDRRFVGLRVGVPINRLETLRFLVDGNAEHDWTTMPDGSEASANVYAGRIGLSWQLSGSFSAALDYSIRDQHASSTGSAPSTFASIRRQMAMLTVEARYPSQF